MGETSLQTVQLQQFLERWQAGDRAAADDLYRIIGARVEQLARKMLRNYPRVRNWAETGDIVQGATWRLLQSLQKINPASTRDFYSLAAIHIRRELLDLARRYNSRPAPGLDEPEAERAAAPDAPAEELELWSRFHAAVEKLECEDREVFSLVFYHGWTQPQIAELFDVTERTVRRRWQGACLKLASFMGGQLPEL